MAKDGNTFAKRQRETLKRQKAQEKRVRRQKRKDQPSGGGIAQGDEALPSDQDDAAPLPDSTN